MDDLIRAAGSLSLNTPVHQGGTIDIINRRYLVQTVLQPSLDMSRYANLLEPSHAFFARARSVFESVRGILNLPEQSFLNFQKLACGDLRMPVILLLNPMDTHDYPYDRMVNATRSLQYLRDTYLSFIGLKLEDVIVIDIFPFLTSNKLMQLAPAERFRLTGLVFGVTFDFLDTFRPDIVISCQCKSRSTEELFGYFSDPLGTTLCSSMAGANAQQVKRLRFNGSLIHIVQAYHPSVFVNYSSGDEKQRLKKSWEHLLDELYTPCASWYKQSVLKPNAAPALTSMTIAADIKQRQDLVDVCNICADQIRVLTQLLRNDSPKQLQAADVRQAHTQLQKVETALCDINRLFGHGL